MGDASTPSGIPGSLSINTSACPACRSITISSSSSRVAGIHPIHTPGSCGVLGAAAAASVLPQHPCACVQRPVTSVPVFPYASAVEQASDLWSLDPDLVCTNRVRLSHHNKALVRGQSHAVGIVKTLQTAGSCCLSAQMAAARVALERCGKMSYTSNAAARTASESGYSTKHVWWVYQRQGGGEGSLPLLRQPVRDQCVS